MPKSREVIDPRVSTATKLLRTYYTEGRTRTDLLKEIADLVVDLRASHTLADGREDLGGRSHPYREVIRTIYHDAGIAAEDLDGVQTALRYHVNNRLHELYDAETLTAAGIGGVSHRERLHISRDLLIELNATMTDQAKLAAHIDTLTESLDAAGIIAGPAARARAARHALISADKRLQAVIAALDESLPRRRRAV